MVLGANVHNANLLDHYDFLDLAYFVCAFLPLGILNRLRPPNNDQGSLIIFIINHLQN